MCPLYTSPCYYHVQYKYNNFFVFVYTSCVMSRIHWQYMHANHDQYKKRQHLEDYNSVRCCVWVSGSACSGHVGKILTGKSHVIVSTVAGSSFFQNVALEPDRLAVGVALMSSLGAVRLIRNSKWSCHFTLTNKQNVITVNVIIIIT